jgi:hypothetical protein
VFECHCNFAFQTRISISVQYLQQNFQYLASLIGQHPDLVQWWSCVDQSWFAAVLQHAFPLVPVPAQHASIGDASGVSTERFGRPLKPLPGVPPHTLVVHLRHLVAPSLIESMSQSDLDSEQRPMYECVASILAAQRQRFDFIYLMHDPKPNRASISARRAIEALLRALSDNEVSKTNHTDTRRRTRLLPPLSVSFSEMKAFAEICNSSSGATAQHSDCELAATLRELTHVSTGEAFVHTLFSSFSTLAQAVASAALNGKRRDAWVFRLGERLTPVSNVEPKNTRLQIRGAPMARGKSDRDSLIGNQIGATWTQRVDFQARAEPDWFKTSSNMVGGRCATRSKTAGESFTVHSNAREGKQNCWYTQIGAEPLYPHLSRAFSSCLQPYRPVHGAFERTEY